MRENPSRTGNVTRTWKATIVQNRSEPKIGTACTKLHTTKTSKESKPKQKIFVIICDTIQTYTDIYKTQHFKMVFNMLTLWLVLLPSIGIQKKTLNLVAVLCLSHKEHVCKSYIYIATRLDQSTA